MRLAIDAWNLVNDRRGMGRYVRNILAGLAVRDDIECTLLVRDPAHVKEVQAETQLCTIASNAVDREAPFDVVWYPWNGIRFRVGNAARVTTIYDMFAFTAPHRDFVARWREQRPIREALAKSDVICTISRWSESEIRRIAPKCKAPIVLASPVPDGFWQPAPPDAVAAAPAGKPYVLIVAGPDERKNVGTAIHAMARAFPDRSVQFVVAGHLRDEDAALLRNSTCDFLRVKPNDDELRELYRHALVVLVPSKLEGYGLMVIEAMACGAPVIASNSSALPEAADGAALLVAPDDVDAWTGAIRELADDAELRRKYAARGLERVVRVSMDSALDETIRAYRDAPLFRG